ncbi:pentatricopeptide repeat-containing protein At4g38150 [Malania oleifera]|uniref:pentatricopeptide repeat-containing protein At4g38150 n=1 Tax=Malania oleifera TaxID=397392 RepID=UPI0025ADB8C9|nr:pentatricopeptide repeat-containing protein At4g38150 [Malania oleifera]
MPALPGRVVSKRIFSKFLSNPLACVSESIAGNRPIPFSSSPFLRFSSIDGNAQKNDRGNDRLNGDDGDSYYSKIHQNPPEPIPNRPLRGERRVYNQPDRISQRNLGLRRNDDDYGDRDVKTTASATNGNSYSRNKPLYSGGGNRGRPRSAGELFPEKLNNIGDTGSGKASPARTSDNKLSDDNFLERFKLGGDHKREETKISDDFLEKLKLGGDKSEKTPQNASTSTPQSTGNAEKQEQQPQPEDADEIFRKMKETGLVPNAVAMLDGLCKDGLVQEAMKLFGSMREKGTFPEVVIYTAVVEGFCKAQKLEDAKRIFRKMQSNGISPNAFSYTVLIQGMCNGERLEDGAEFCVEMLEAGHSPNVATFVGVVSGFCKEKSVEEAVRFIERLMQKGYFVNEKAIREYLDKKGPFLPLVWEAIFGKKKSSRLGF